MRTITNLYDNLPACLPEELTETLASSSHVRIERIVSENHSSPEEFWYDQECHEWITLVQGSATLEFETPNKKISLKPGDSLLIKAHERHRVESTAKMTKTIWLAVHFS